MQKKSLLSRAYWVVIVAGMVTGMGKGSVFGAAMMCFLGRGEFNDWGGWWPVDYEPQTFTGFIDWCMIVFGLAYVFIMVIALKRHNADENPRDTVGQKA